MKNTDDKCWDLEYDVVVVGSGNGGLTAGIVARGHGARTLVIEKTDQYGGTSATSGGGVWVPCNRYAVEAGAEDSLEDARAYLAHMTPPGTVPDETIDTYLREAPQMINYLHNQTRWVEYLNLPFYPDYFPHAPGGRTGSRSMEPRPIDGRLLGKKWLKQLRPQHPQTTMFGLIHFTQVEGQKLLGALPGWWKLAAKLILDYLLDIPMRIRSTRHRRLTMGNAGVARLRLALEEQGAILWLNTPMTGLVTENRQVTGITAMVDGKPTRIRACWGVILAAGGFERNQEMREQYLPNPTKADWSASNLYNTGDAISAAQAIGAATRQMDWAWWSVTVRPPGREKSQMVMVEQSMPGNYTVNGNGERFTNESQNYISIIMDIYQYYKKGNPCIPCYMIFDANFRRNRPCGPLVQGKFVPDWLLPRSWWTPNFLVKANTLRKLAKKLGMDPDVLEETQRKVNEYARSGKDLDFQRGDSVYDRYYGDPSIKPNPCLGPLEKPPFYAMTMHPGDMGTAGGLAVNTSAQVLREDDTPIPGLYAIGNCSAAVLPRYPGPGSTLGPAMTFGYIAARHITENISYDGELA